MVKIVKSSLSWISRRVAAAAIVIFVTGVGFTRAETESQNNSQQRGPGSTVAVAVVPFTPRGNSIEYNRWGKALAEMLASDLSQYEVLNVLERQAADDLIRERDLAKAGLTDREGNAQRNKQAADYLVTGTCAVEKGKLTITARLSKIGVPKPSGEWTLEGTVDDLFKLERELAGKLTDSLKIETSARRKLPPADSGPTPTLAILPLLNHSPEARLDVMQTGFAEILQANLGALKQIRLVDRSKLEAVLEEQKLALSGLTDSTTAVQIGKLLQAQRLLVGSFLEQGKHISVRVRLVDTGNAAVLASEKVDGPVDEFARLLEDLSLRIAADLSVRPPADQQQALRETLAGRSLEAAMHFNRGNRLRHENKLADASAAFGQALLVDPGHIKAARERVEALFDLAMHDEAIRTGQQAMTQEEFRHTPIWVRHELVKSIAKVCADVHRADDLAPLAEFERNEVPLERGRWVNYNYIETLRYVKRDDEAERVLIRRAGEHVGKMPDFRNPDLRDLYEFYRTHGWWFDRHQRIDEKASREMCRKAIEIQDRVLSSLEGQKQWDQDVERWANTLVPYLSQINYLDGKGKGQSFLAPAERAERLRRALKVFEANEEIQVNGILELAAHYEAAESWTDAIATYRRFLAIKNPHGRHSWPITSDLTTHNTPPAGLSERMRAYSAVATILGDKLDRADEAREALRVMINDVGLSNLYGPATMKALHKLNMPIEVPGKCALLFGGETIAHRSWKRSLVETGIRVHSLRQLAFTASDLSPYPLVILNRCGKKPYQPIEVLALRSYVAAGGSLLVIVSPGWEPAAPGIHNSLLGLFGMEAGDDEVLWADSTRIAPHPITSGIERARAKKAVSIKAPPDTRLIEAGNRTILAVAPYRLGRVAVASFGQWYLPDLTVIPREDWSWMNRSHPTGALPADESPIEFDQMERPLLQNLVRWLYDAPPLSAAHANWRKQLDAVHLTIRKARSKVLPYEDLQPAFERLISQAPDALTKEESLWIAAEAYIEWDYQSAHTNRVRRNAAEPMRPDASPPWYQRLISQFPESTARPFAQWRLAEHDRRYPSVQSNARQVVALYDRITSPQGSVPWAWKNLSAGEVLAHNGDPKQAAARYREIVEHFPNSPERIFALISLGKCYRSMGQIAEARRAFEAVNGLPEINWVPYGGVDDWIPLDDVQYPGDSKYHVGIELKGLESQ